MFKTCPYLNTDCSGSCARYDHVTNQCADLTFIDALVLIADKLHDIEENSVGDSPSVKLARGDYRERLIDRAAKFDAYLRPHKYEQA